MADQPTVVNNDLSEIAMFNNIFGDRTVTVGIGEVLAKYTVLGWDGANEATIICESDNTDGADVPRFILMQDLDNSAGESATDFDNIRVMLEGEFDADLIVFDNGTDTLDTVGETSLVSMRDAMKTEGLIAIERNDLSKLDNQ